MIQPLSEALRHVVKLAIADEQARWCGRTNNIDYNPAHDEAFRYADSGCAGSFDQIINTDEDGREIRICSFDQARAFDRLFPPIGAAS